MWCLALVLNHRDQPYSVLEDIGVLQRQRALCSSHIISELPRSLEPPGQGLETPNSPQRAWIEKDLLFFFSFMLLD